MCTRRMERIVTRAGWAIFGDYRRKYEKLYQTPEELVEDAERVIEEVQKRCTRRLIYPGEIEEWIRDNWEYLDGLWLLACGGGVSYSYPGTAYATFFSLSAVRGYKGVYAYVSAERGTAPRVPYGHGQCWIEGEYEPLLVFLPTGGGEKSLDVAWYQMVENWWGTFEEVTGIPREIVREWVDLLDRETKVKIVNSAFGVGQSLRPAPKRLLRTLRELAKKNGIIAEAFVGVAL